MPVDRRHVCGEWAAVHAGGRSAEATRAGLISIDATSVRAHQHAAGAPIHTGGTIEQLAPLVAACTAAHGRQFRLLADKGYAHDP